MAHFISKYIYIYIYIYVKFDHSLSFTNAMHPY